jgi:hypothetical protein
LYLLAEAKPERSILVKAASPHAGWPLVFRPGRMGFSYIPDPRSSLGTPEGIALGKNK